MTDEENGRVTIERNGVYLHVSLHAVNNGLAMRSWTGFPIEPDPKYSDLKFINSQVYLREPAVDQAHFQANTRDDKEEQTIFAVLWPSREADDGGQLKVKLIHSETLEVVRPDGVTDLIRLNDEGLWLTSPES